MSKKLATLLAALVLGLGLTARAAPRHARAAHVQLSGVVNLNTASEAELEALPGVGPAKAKRILELRAQHRFASADQVMQVKGIGRKSFQKLKPFLAMSGPTTLAQKSAAPPKAEANGG